MKKFLPLIILALMAFARGTCLATDYQLWVAGIQVTSNNASQIMGSGITGTVSYDASTNVLTLNNAQIINTGSGADGIQTGIAGLKINLIGSNTITTSDDGMQVNGTDLTITGPGSLNIDSYYGFYLGSSSNATLTFRDNCTVYINATSYGIGYINSGSVVVNCSTLYVKGGYRAVSCHSFTQSGTAIASPVDARFMESAGAICYTGSTTPVSGDDVVFIEPCIVVQGNVMTSVNGWASHVDGVTYDPNTKFLYLDNATIDYPGYFHNGIEANIEGMYIFLKGKNTINAGVAGIQIGAANITLYGYGTLDITANHGIYSAEGLNHTLKILECHLNVDGNTNGILYPNGTVDITDALVRAKGNSSSFACADLQLSAAKLIYPSGTQFGGTSIEYISSGQTVAGEYVIFVPQFRVKDVFLNQANASDMLGDGTVSYDVLENVLTLNNADVNIDNDICIFSCVNDLTIKLIGNNTVRGSTGIYSNKNLTIDGDGSMLVQGIQENGIRAYGGLTRINLTIQGGCDVEVQGAQKGIIVGDTLTISNSTVKATGADGSILTQNLVLDGCEFTAPEDAEWIPADNGQAYVTVGGQTVTEQVVIEHVEYDLWVAGTQVTTTNKDDILGDGKVSYNSNNKVLTLNEAEITNNNGDGIKNGIENLIIRTVAYSVINASGSGIYSNADFVIEGTEEDGVTLYADADGIWAYNCDLTIQGGCMVTARTNATSLYAGISGYVGHSLTIDFSTVVADAPDSNKSGIYGFGNFNLLSCIIVVPEDSRWDDNDHCVRDGNDDPAPTVMINPITYYDIWVAGTQVTSLNASDVLRDGGSVSYTNGTLELYNAEIVNNNGYGIENRIDYLGIHVYGENTITASSSGIYSIGDISIFTFLGDDSLTITGDDGIYAANNCLISYCTMNVTATGVGDYAGIKSYYGSLYIDNSTIVVNAPNSTTSGIYGFDYLYFDECAITTPEGCSWDATDRCVKDSNDVPVLNLVISPIYDLWVAGTQVTSFNASDVLGDGTVSYNAVNRTLTLNNAEIVNNNGYGIENRIQLLTIKLEGSNSITSFASGIYSQGEDFIIEGPDNSSLTISGDEGIRAYQCDLLIQGGCTVNATATSMDYNAGIFGDNGYNLTIDNSTVVANSPNSSTKSAIYGFSHLNLTECAITTPKGCRWDEDDLCVKDSNDNLVYSLIISPIIYYQLYVAGIQVSSANASDVLGDGQGSLATGGGSVNYDAETNTLTLYNAEIVNMNLGGPDNSDGIYNRINGLTIKPVGRNTIKAADDGINTDGTATIIKGEFPNSVLYIEAPYGIYGYDEHTSLTINNNAYVEVNSNSCGVDFIMGSLVISDSELRTSGTFFSLLCYELTLTGCSLISPVGAHFENSRLVDEDGQVVTTQVVIAQNVFDLYVGETQVTLSNASDVLGDGTVSYDPLNKVLTLDNAEIEGTSSYGIVNENDELTIELIGENSINGYGVGICTNYPTIITGTGSLSISTQIGMGSNDYHEWGSHVIIDGCSVDFITTRCGIILHTLEVLDAELRVYTTPDETGPCFICTELLLEGCSITSPEGAHWNSQTHHVEDSNGNNLEGQVIISPNAYDLYVAGIQVNTLNASDVFGNGTVSYDAVTNELTLNNASISYTGNGNSGIVNNIDNLTISLVGENSINAGNCGVEIGAANTTFSGQGKLSINANFGIYSGSDAFGHTLAFIDGCDVTIVGHSEGILYINGTLIVSGATVRAKGEIETSVSCKYLEVYLGSLIWPYGAHLSNSRISDLDNDYIQGEFVYFYPRLEVGGNLVTSLNCNDVLNDGHVSYDAPNNILTLNNAHIVNLESDDPLGADGILNWIEGLTIKLLGENTIEAGDDGIDTNKDSVLITGPGSLVVNAEFGIYVMLYGLTIADGCNLDLTGSYAGIIVDYGTLTIRNANVKAIGSDWGSIRTKNLVLEGCRITAPEGAEWISAYPDKACVTVNGVTVTTQVVISMDVYDLYVAGIQVNAANASDVLGDGTVSYDAATYTLTLDNADIKSYEDQSDNPDPDGIHNGIEYLTIKLVGENSIYADDDGINTENHHTTITGTGSLNILSYFGIYSEGYSSLTLNGNCIVSVYGYNAGVAFDEDGEIWIDGSTLKAYNRGDSQYFEGSITAGYISLNNAEITQPEDAYLDMCSDDLMRVLDDDGDIFTGWVHIEAYNTFFATIDSDWNDADNWSRGTVPADNDKVIIAAPCVPDVNVTMNKIVMGNEGKLTIPSGKIVKVNDINGTNSGDDKLIVKDGGQLIHYCNNVAATIERDITGYGSTNGRYYLIGTPYSLEIANTNLATGDYDLYSYDEPTSYWINSKHVNEESGAYEFMSLQRGKGYLYANKNDITIRAKSYPLVKADGYVSTHMTHVGEHLTGFNLVGNPLACNANVCIYNDIDNPIFSDYYKMNAAGTELEMVSSATPLKPMEAVFVQYEGEYYSALFRAVDNSGRGVNAADSDLINLSVSKAEEGATALNNVIIRFGEGHNVGKFMLNAANTRLSIVSEGKEYGSYYADDNATLSLNFKAAEAGRYTISTNDMETLHGVSLHLVDTLTGIETDLSQGSYTFLASPDDSAERFMVTIKH